MSLPPRTRRSLGLVWSQAEPWDQVAKESRPTGVLKETAEKQIPWETSSLTGDFCFRSGDSGECPAAAFAGASR